MLCEIGLNSPTPGLPHINGGLGRQAELFYIVSLHKFIGLLCLNLFASLSFKWLRGVYLHHQRSGNKTKQNKNTINK